MNECLTTDPGMGIVRHVDAGYELAEKTAREKGVNIPMMDKGGDCRMKTIVWIKHASQLATLAQAEQHRE